MALVKYNDNSISAITSTGLATGAMVLIKSITASSDSTISFVDGSSDVDLDATYPIYKFEFNSIHPSADSNQFRINFSTDGGSNYNVAKSSTVWRAIHSEGGSHGSGYNTSNDLANATGVQILASSLGADADHTTQGYLWLFNPSSTTFYKHFLARVSTTESDDGTMDFFVAGFCATTSAINAAQFSMTSGNVDAGKIKLYGLKDS